MIRINEMRIPLFHLDAFTDHVFGGNPAAVCLLNSWLDDDSLRKVAAENNLSETAFLVALEGGYELRWFSPRCEVKLCGHATLAAAQLILELLRPHQLLVRFSTRFHGDLYARKERNLLSMDFPALPPQSALKVPDHFERALGGKYPVEILEANETFVSVFKSEADILALQPDFALLEQFHPFTVAITAPGRDTDFVSRYFAPSYGIAEDPVTGSAHCVLAPYWARRLNKSRLNARQLSERGGELICEVVNDRVLIRGTAVLVLRGALTI